MAQIIEGALLSLEHCDDEKEFSRLLNVIKAVPMTIELLQKTKVAIQLKSLKKRMPPECGELARSLISTWKLGLIFAPQPEPQAQPKLNATATPPMIPTPPKASITTKTTKNQTKQESTIKNDAYDSDNERQSKIPTKTKGVSEGQTRNTLTTTTTTTNNKQTTTSNKQTTSKSVPRGDVRRRRFRSSGGPGSATASKGHKTNRGPNQTLTQHHQSSFFFRQPLLFASQLLFDLSLGCQGCSELSC